jgi:hypothetical protein
MQMTISRLIQAAFVATLGAMSGFIAPVTDTKVEPTEVALCEGGAHNKIGLTLSPKWVSRGKSGEVLGLSLDVSSRFEGPARTRVAIEMTDDLGRPVMDAKVSDKMRFASERGAPQGLDLRTPDELSDGYYKIRVTAAGLADDGEDAENIVQMYLVREKGEFRTVSYEEFVSQSNELREVTF